MRGGWEEISQDSKKGGKTAKEKNPDWDWDYWEAQIEAYQKALRKPIWRDYLETQRKLLDRVHDYFWEEDVGNNE